MDTTNSVIISRIKKPAASRLRSWRFIFSWMLMWEIYPLVCIATFLRFYQFPTTEFDADQAAIFSLARNALVHGQIPVTANLSSINILNPPATVYLLMPGALFTANPYAGVIVVGILNVLAVLLTYAVVCRYYGRVAGTVAGFLYATAQLVVFYGGFLWNQNLLAPFVPLFIFALFWGVVERRRGWLAPAVALWGWMLQLHGSAILLLIPLGLACILAFKTLRWRDVFLAAGLLVLMYVPYIVWEFVHHFADVLILLSSFGKKSRIDTQALHAYLDFLNPYTHAPTKRLTLLYRFYLLFRREGQCTLVLAACAFGFTLLAVCRGRWNIFSLAPRGGNVPGGFVANSTAFWSQLRGWWRDLVATPWRCGLLILLIWQIVPVVALSRHSLLLYDYYLLVLMPGPFILIGVFAARVVAWLRSFRPPWQLARYAFILLLVGMVVVQSLGSLARTLDEAAGYNSHDHTYYTLRDMQHALNEADRLARLYHVRHVYIAIDQYTKDTLTYLAGQMQTSHTIYSGLRCLPLPGPGQGPALMLFSPTDALDEALLTHFAAARLVDEPPRLAGRPFHLYLVQSASYAWSRSLFLNNLAPTTGQAEPFSWVNPLAQPSSTTLQKPAASPLLLTRWNVLRAASSSYDTSYNYMLIARYHGHGLDGHASEDICSFSGLQPGEQILAAFSLPAGNTTMPVSLSLTGATWITTPYSPAYGPVHLETFMHSSTPEMPLRSSSGGDSLDLQG